MATEFTWSGVGIFGIFPVREFSIRDEMKRWRPLLFNTKQLSWQIMMDF